MPTFIDYVQYESIHLNLPFGINFEFDCMSLEDTLTCTIFRLEFGNEFFVVFGIVSVVNDGSLCLEWRFLWIKSWSVLSVPMDWCSTHLWIWEFHLDVRVDFLGIRNVIPNATDNVDFKFRFG